MFGYGWLDPIDALDDFLPEGGDLPMEKAVNKMTTNFLSINHSKRLKLHTIRLSNLDQIQSFGMAFIIEL